MELIVIGTVILLLGIFFSSTYFSNKFSSNKEAKRRIYESVIKMHESVIKMHESREETREETRKRIEEIAAMLGSIKGKTNEINDKILHSSKSTFVNIFLYDLSKQNKIISKIMLFFSASLIESIIKISEQVVNASAEDKKSHTIVGLMLGEKMVKSSKAKLFLILALIINFVSTLLIFSSINVYVFLFVAFFLLLIYSDHKLIEYRVKNGFYGSNKFEALEIINFIISHADKNDFNNSGGLKKVIPKPELILRESQESRGRVFI